MGQSIKAWIGLTLVVALLVVAAGWFVVISPTKAATAETRASVDSEMSRSLVLAKDLSTLKAQNAILGKSKAELAALTTQIPTSAGLAAFRRSLVERAQASGVTILSISTDVSTAVNVAAATPQAAAAPAPSSAGAATPSPSPSPSPSPEAPTTAATPATTVDGQVLIGLPLSISVVGTYDAVRSFIASLQTKDGRLFLVSSLGLISQLDNPASLGRPETVKGDVEAAIQGFLFALPQVATDSKDAGGVPTPLPLPTTERNPFAPLAPATTG